MRKTYTVRQWLQLLEPEIRKMAIANMDNPKCKHPSGRSDSQADTLARAIDLSAHWDKTPQGRDFWGDQYDAARRNTRTPREVMGVDCTIPE